MRRALDIAALAAAALVVVLPVAAQEATTGSIAGRVLDSQGGVVPGARVTLGSGQGSRTFVTDAQGRFLAPYLTPGIYSARAELAGFAPADQDGVRLHLGQRLELGFTLTVATLETSVDVAGKARVADTSTTVAGGVLDSAELARLPVTRRLTSTLYMVPGVSSSSGAGEANPSISGASGLENNYTVDGVDITNPGFGGMGVYTLRYGSLGLGVTTDFVQETQVKTAGFQAEYGEATGGVVNVITRSGSNAFHGNVFGYWRPAALEGGWRQQQTAAGQVNTTATQALDVGASLGGALVKDRLFVFGAFDPQDETRTLVAPAGFALERLGEVDQERRTLAYAAKLTWQANSAHRIDLSVFGDPSHGPPGPQRPLALLFEDTTAFSELVSYGGHNQVLRYSGAFGSRWLVEATTGHAATSSTERPGIDERRVNDLTVVPSAFSGGIGMYEAGTNGGSLQLALKSTNLFSARGHHELRYGVQFDDVDFTIFNNFTGPSFTFPNGAQSRTGVRVNVYPDPVFGAIYRVFGTLGDPPVSSQKYLSWFAQDSWRIGRRLTLRPGIRWERQRLQGGEPICYSDESFVGAGDGTPGHEVNCSYTWSNNWGPRLGAVFDVTGAGRSRLYASWGLFYAKIPNDVAVYALSDEGSASADYFDAALMQPVPEGILALRTKQHSQIFGGHPAQFANGSRSTYNDELALGLEIEAVPSLSLGVSYVHRSLHQVLENYSPAQPVLYDLGLVADVPYFIDNITHSLKTLDFTSQGVPEAFFEDPVRLYDALVVTAHKTLSRSWSLLGSYRWSRLRGNFEGFYRSDNGDSAPVLGSLFDFPTNDPSYSQIGVPQFGYRGDIRYQGTTLGVGPLPNDRPHQLKLYGSYTWRGLTSSLAFRAGSGAPLTALAVNPRYGAAGEIPETLRGAGIETVDGFRRRAPAEVLVDLHLDYTFLLGGTRQVVLVADAFNLLNSRDPISYDTYTQVDVGVPNPDFGRAAAFGGSQQTAFETPRQVLLGARLQW
ncbi:MAG TPA: TonB-dependent receptor [Vicinamibacteria bacterium]|nr:TonB-dependent receptor [Vicinamibacteria bacterium]